MSANLFLCAGISTHITSLLLFAPYISSPSILPTLIFDTQIPIAFSTNPSYFASTSTSSELYPWLPKSILEVLLRMLQFLNFSTYHSTYLCKFGQCFKIYISWQITLTWHLPEVRTWNKLMIFDSSNTVWKYTFISIISIQYCTPILWYYFS